MRKKRKKGRRVETPIHVSLRVTEHLRPEVRKKELHSFWEGEIDESWGRCSLGMEGWMEIIFFQCFSFSGELLVYCLHSSLPPLLSFPPPLLSVPRHISLAPIAVSLPPHCPTHVYFDTQPLLGEAEGRPQPSVS